MTRRQWNALNEPVVSDLKKRVVRKNKKARAKSAGPTPAKQAKPNPPVPAAPQQVAQAPVAGAEGMDVVADDNSSAEPSVEQAVVSGGPSLPNPVNPPPLVAVNPPTPSVQNPGDGAIWYPEAAPFRGRGLPRGRKRTRHRGGVGWNPHMSSPRGQRGGGNTNPRNPGPADVSSRGNGGYNRNSWGQGYGQAFCNRCNIPYPGWIRTCTFCYANVS